METVKLQSFNWSISNQVNFRIPACEPWRLNVNRTFIPDFLPSYLLTIFPIGNGKDPKTILIEAENGANEFDWVIDEPIGSKVALRLRDTNGAEGGYLPHLFEIVAGRSTECIRSVQAPVHSEFSFRSDVVEQPEHSKAIHVDVHGGIPPYEATLISMKSSGAQAILPVPFYQSPLFHSIEIIRNDSILIVVSDSEMGRRIVRLPLWAISDWNSKCAIFRSRSSFYFPNVKRATHAEQAIVRRWDRHHCSRYYCPGHAHNSDGSHHPLRCPSTEKAETTRPTRTCDENAECRRIFRRGGPRGCSASERG
ncbi:hypothetical protein BDN70DRAFT_358321 [Pholiota conissans]|uniref:Uncharacterized protein n=1 Tax=Pholiota conissans TaxID=109636 RepID=A0A9P6D4W4_9AGAR|nr:hypothetical protein BDN70DRAFT_358321 [Pholiota conissans]